MTTPPADAPDRENREPVEPRVTLRGLIGEVLSAFNLERGVVRTVIDLTLRPQVVLRRYLQAPKRSGYMNVWSYFLLTTGAMLLIENLFPRPFPSPIADISHLLVRYRAAMLALSLPISALATLVLFRRWKLSYAEHLVVAAFITAQVQCFWLLIHPLAVLGLVLPLTLAAMLVVTLYPALVVYLFDQPAGRLRMARSLFTALVYLGGQFIVAAIFMAFFLIVR